MMKRIIKNKHPNIWNFLWHMRNIFEDKATDYLRFLEDDSTGNILRKQSNQTIATLQLRRETEALLDLIFMT